VIFMFMNKDLKKLIKDVLDEMFDKSYGERNWRTAGEICEDTCPHCRRIIMEYHDCTDDGGKTWTHLDCGGVI
jgi:hypothetical protein